MEKIDIETADARIKAAYDEGFAEGKGEVLQDSPTSRKWVWCSDHRCRQRKEFPSLKACNAHKKDNGGYCYSRVVPRSKNKPNKTAHTNPLPRLESKF